MEKLIDILDDLKLITDDFNNLIEIISLLKKKHIHKATDKINNLDTAVRDYCLEYFNEDMLDQVEFCGRGKLTGRKHATLYLAKKVEEGAALYLVHQFSAVLKECREFLNAKKTKNS